MKEFFRFGLIGLVIGLGVGLALAGWSNPTGPPTDLAGTNAPEPINVGPATQTKTGQLIINGFLTAPTIFTGKLGIGPGAVISFDPFAVLDVDGQIRIRGGGAAANRVLTSDANGLASWGVAPAAGINALYEGNGIDLTPNTIIPTSGTIAINDAYTQRRVGPTCAAGQEIYSISQTGVASCRPATISLTAGTGLTATPVNPITNAGTISINPLVTQQRVSGTCAVGAIATISQTGTVTCQSSNINLTPGTGITLTPNPITNTGTVAINPAVTQQRVSGTCAVGQTISAIAQDGTVTCRPATVSLTPGTGITLTPNPITNTGTVAINPAVTQQRVSGGCLITGGIRAINADGTVVCGSCN